MAGITLHGPAYSAYTRTVRLALDYKGLAYDLVPVDLIRTPRSARKTPHPLGLVPALEDDGQTIVESLAIMAHLERAHGGPVLMPAGQEVKSFALWALIADAVSRPARNGLIAEALFKPLLGLPADAGKAAAAACDVARGLQAVEIYAAEGEFLAGDDISIADLLLYPLTDYIALCPGGADLLADRRRIAAWQELMSGFAWVRASAYDLRPEALQGPASVQ